MFDFFDADYNYLSFLQGQGHGHAKQKPAKPVHFEEIKLLAGKPSKGLPHTRLNFYEIGNKVLFGEITLFHFSGFVPFEPEV